MKWLSKIKNEVKVILLLILSGWALAFVQKMQSDKICSSVQVELINPEKSRFVDETDIRKLISGDASVNITGTPYRRINLKEIENRAMTNPYVREAQAFKDHKGNVVVEIFVARPIARILRDGKPDLYISDRGDMIQESDKYTSRVMLISGAYTVLFGENLRKDTYQKKIFDFISHVHSDPFWKAQIAQMEIDSEGEVKIYPQVSRQTIEFGTVENWEEKLMKLKIFYEKILPYKGWNTYTRVNLVYENQIICE